MKYVGNDFYCDVAFKKIINLNIKYESENVLAFDHTKPSYPVHIMVVPKKHISSFTALTEEDSDIMLEIIKVIKTIAKEVDKEYGGVRIVTNLGKYQESKHLHIHITSGESFIK